MNQRLVRLLALSVFSALVYTGCSCNEEVEVLDDAGVEDTASDSGDASSNVDVARDVGGQPDGESPEVGGPDSDGGCTLDNECNAELAPCERSACVEGACVVATVNDGVKCDDEDPCTEGETCNQGQCQGGVLKTCPDDSSPCTEAYCTAGFCAQKNLANDTPCDDANACTAGDRCVEGVCEPTECTCAEDCSNGVDDDCDLLADCLDADCADQGVCTGECSYIDTLQCGAKLTVDPALVQTTSTTSDWCSAAGLGGAEAVWALAAPGQNVTVTLSNGPVGARLIHLVESGTAVPTVCNRDLCTNAGTSDDGTELTFTATASAAHSFAVDAPEAGPFDLEVTCTACVPACAGKQCGGDGCGGTCGACSGGLVCLSGACAQAPIAPSNDTCASPQLLPSVLPVIVTGTTLGAQDDVALAPGSPCAGGSSVGLLAPDVVYSFTPPSTGQYVVSLHDTTFPATLYVAGSCSASVSDCLGAVTGQTAGVTTLIVSLEQGKPVTIVVDGLSGPAAGTFTLTLNQWPCAPACAGKLCGPNTCGGTCGGCGAGQVCGPTYSCIVPSPNDTCLTATPLVLGGGQVTVTGSTLAATDGDSTSAGLCAGASAGGGVGAPDVVYALQGPGKFDLTLTSSGFDALLSVRAGCPGGQSVCLGASNTPGAADETITGVVVNAGQTAYVIVDGATAGASGTFSLKVVDDAAACGNCGGKVCGFDSCGASCGSCAAGSNCIAGACAVAPANDSCGTAQLIDSLPFQFSGTTAGALNDLSLAFGVCKDGPQATTYGKGPDVVFKYTPSVTGPVTFQTDPGGTEFLPYVYVQEQCGAPTEATCFAGSSGTSGVSIVKATLTAGKTYYVVVDGLFAPQQGTYLFRAE